jgi:hypothetical protein
MLIKLKPINHHIYDKISYFIQLKYSNESICNETVEENDIMLNAIPIVLNNEYFILINYANLNISGLEFYDSSYKIEYLINEEIKGEIIIKNVYSLQEIYKRTISKEGDCFYDDHTNLLFIKFQDVRVEYIDITKFEFNNFDDIFDTNINFNWIDSRLNKKKLESKNNKIIFENKFINLPNIPLIVSNTSKINFSDDYELPITGSLVMNYLDDIVGIVSYSNEQNIVTIPILVIKRIFDYLNGKQISTFDFNLKLTKIILDDEIFYYGLYSKNYKKNKFLDHEKKVNIITKINNNKIDNRGNIILNKINFPISTYIWLFVVKDKVNIYSINAIKGRLTKEENIYLLNLIEANKPKYNNYEIKLKSALNNTLCVSKLNFIKSKNKIILELNEKIMQILKNIIQTTNDYDYLYDYIIKNKYSKHKIVVSINERLEIKIIQKINNKNIKNIKSITNIFDDEKSLKNFLDNY